MTEIKKKNYVSPSMEVYEVKSMQLLAGSNGSNDSNDIVIGGEED